ncbi:MAG: hypothetical protein QXP59_00620 [Saccharolobus sp.]
MSLSNGKIINKWTQFYLPNEDAYKKIIQKFLDTNFVKLPSNGKEPKLASYRKKKIDKNIKRKGLIFFSQKEKSKNIVITFEKYDKEVEDKILKYIKKRFPKKVIIKEKIYYLVKLSPSNYLNKRAICEKLLKKDYDLMHYKSPVLEKTIIYEGNEYKVGIQFFENGIKFLAYPSIKAILKEQKFINDIIHKYKM